jgi:hypothetical protein
MSQVKSIGRFLQLRREEGTKNYTEFTAGELTTNQVFFETLHGVALKGF